MAYGSESEDSVTGAKSLESTLKPVLTSGVRSAAKKDSKQYHCTVEGCKSSFTRPWRLEAHISVHCGETPFKCNVEGCIKGYTSKSHLVRHKKTAHSSGFSPSTLYKCPHEGCGALLKTNQNLKKHFKRAHVVSRECKECGKKFTKMIQLKYHMQYHTGEFIHQCEECDLKFLRKTEYNRHMARHRIHACPYPRCNIGFAQWSSVRRHLAKDHTPKFTCYHCNKPFIFKHLLRSHVVSHIPGGRTQSALKCYQCYHCDKSLCGKQSLRRHIKTIHFRKKSSRPVKCNRPRKPRKDKGSTKPPITAFASDFSGVEIPKPLTTTLLNSYEPVLETPEEIIAAIEEALLSS